MIRIAAVDDDRLFLQTLKDIIALQIDIHQYSYELDLYDDSEMFLNCQMTAPYDLVFLDMDMPKYLSEEDLLNKYWGKINVFNFDFNHDLILNDTESFPMSIAQMLSNSLFFVQNEYYQNLDMSSFNALPEETQEKVMLYFNYSTFFIIENSYDNLLQDQFDKLREIPDLLTKHNENKKDPVFLIILYSFSLFILQINR